MRTATVAILMLFSTITMAQYSLSGHVTEKSNNKGLLGANVSISSNNTIVVATDEKGYFETPIYQRGLFGPGNKIQGPAIIEAKDTTIVIPPGYKYLVDEFMNGVIEVL